MALRKNRDEFVRKFRQKFPNTNDGEIKNFIRIYLQPTLDYKKNDLGEFIFHDEEGLKWPNVRTCFVGIYLKELNIDQNYGWFFETNQSGLDFPKVNNCNCGFS